MNRHRRALTILMVAAMLVALLAAPAMADLEYFFQAEWTVADNGDGTGAVTVTLSHIYAGTSYSTPDDAADFRHNFSELKPQLLLERDGAELLRVDIPAPGASASTATCTVQFDGQGQYMATVVAKGYDASFSLTGGFFDGILYPVGGMGFDFTGESAGGEPADLSGLYAPYFDMLREYLYFADIADAADLVAAVQGVPALAQELHSMTVDVGASLAQAGAQSLGEYAKTYEDGRYAALVAYLASADGAFGGSGEEVPAVGAPLFSDVSDDAWYAEYVYLAADFGLVRGTGDGSTFSPGANLTYAEAITLAARMRAFYFSGDEGHEEDTFIGEAGEGEPWYQPYVDYAKKFDIPWQYADYTAKITREEYVHIFYAAMPRDSYDQINLVADGAIPDIAMSHPYAEEIYALYRAGILTGSDAAGTFNPQSNILRSEVATIVCRMTLRDLRQHIELG
ncbi:MAG: S-layer homology domain-containing protein [Clostridiales bacterium]|nr:S-layer homology domain-containing protein [Clostridiales bacterium]